jgi:hypothetical protein
MRATGGDESGRRGAEHELEHLSALPSHLQPPAVFVNRDHGAKLEAAAEMRDARVSADVWKGS